MQDYVWEIVKRSLQVYQSTKEAQSSRWVFSLTLNDQEIIDSICSKQHHY